MRKFKVSSELRPYILNVLRRYGIPFRTFTEGGKKYVETKGISGTKFHSIVQRANCEKKSLETGEFFVTNKELNNPIVLNDLLQAAGRTDCQVMR